MRIRKSRDQLFITEYLLVPISDPFGQPPDPLSGTATRAVSIYENPGIPPQIEAHRSGPAPRRWRRRSGCASLSCRAHVRALRGIRRSPKSLTLMIVGNVLGLPRQSA